MKWFLAGFFAISFVFLAVFGVNCCYGYLFPLKYMDEVEQASQTFDVDKAVILAMINVESRFKKNAISNKGAVGLMQVMPSTADDLAKELGLESFDLTNPTDNITLGTYYIGQLQKKYGCLETALCAYNAGPTNVNAWLKDSQKSPDGKTLDKIPFAETEKYIKKFRKNLNYYSKKTN